MYNHTFRLFLKKILNPNISSADAVVKKKRGVKNRVFYAPFFMGIGKNASERTN